MLLLIVGGIAAAVIRARQPKPTLVRTAKIEKVDELISLVSASGEIRAHEMVDIQTEIAGVIVDLPVKEGNEIKKGDVLLRIDPFQSQMDKNSAEGRYLAAQADLKRFESTIASALSNIERQRQQIRSLETALAEAEIQAARDRAQLGRYVELLKTKAISRDEFETFESKSKISSNRVENARVLIDQAKAQLRANEIAVEEQRVMKIASQQNLQVARSALDRASDTLRKTTIASPMNGVVVTLNVDVGERAVPGIQSNPQATLMTLANLERIEAELKVDETDIVRLKLGQPATIKCDALPDVDLKGKVTEISAAPINTNANSSRSSGNSQQEGKDFKVVVTIDSPPETLRIGMLCEAEITIDTRQDVLAMPIQALTLREVDVDAKGAYVPPPKPEKGQRTAQAANAEPAGPKKGEGGGKPGGEKGEKKGRKKDKKKEHQGVFVMGADGLAHFRLVKTGIMGDTNVEILEGLKEGDEVITGPLQSLRVLDEWKLVKVDQGAGGGPGGKP